MDELKGQDEVLVPCRVNVPTGYGGRSVDVSQRFFRSDHLEQKTDNKFR